MSVDALHGAMVNQVERASVEEQLALLRAHPDLGARAGERCVGGGAGGRTKCLKASNPAVFRRSSIRSAAKCWAEIPAVAEVHLEAENRTWDTVVERGDELGIYTDARPPYGCLGLRLRR